MVANALFSFFFWFLLWVFAFLVGFCIFKGFLAMGFKIFSSGGSGRVFGGADALSSTR